MSCNQTCHVSLQAEVDARPTTSDLDAFWLVINAEVVFIMQLGFMLLEVGSVRAQHAKSICVKNVVDFLITTIWWLAIGYPFAFGDRGALGYFAGTTFHFGQNLEDTGAHAWPGWFFQWSFASACCTIVSGSGAERCSFKGYIVSTVLLSSFVYPMVVHWCWSNDAWLTKDGLEFYDFAGSGVVHLTGGAAAFSLATIVGPRDGRFSEDSKMAPHNLVLSAAGALFLITGWFGFNGGSVLQASDGNASKAGRACAMTAIGTALGGLFSFYYTYHKYGFINLEKLMNGMLAGAVSVTAGARVFYPFEAIVTGLIGGFIYSVCSELLVRFKIDDPLDASPIHGACGVWGLLAVGLFANDAGVTGLFHGNPAQLGHQILGAVVIIAWSGGITTSVFLTMSHYGVLRVPLEIEIAGDVVLYGGSAYPQFATESAPPEGEIVVVITDVKGSTGLWEWDADTMKEADDLHLKVLRDNIARLDGYEFNEEGDSLSIAFHNTLDAMKFAMLSQTDLMNVNWPEELYDHPDGSKEDGMYNGLRIKMAVDVGFGRKFLNKATNRLSYDGDVVDSCNAMLNAVDDGGVVLSSLSCIEDIKGKFSHREHEIDKVDIQDMGTCSFTELKDPLALIQLVPQWLNKRPPAQLKGVKMIQKPHSQAPGVINPGEPIALMYCTLEQSSTDDEVEGKKTKAVNDAAKGLFSSTVFECGGYISTTTSQGVALVAFDSAQDSFQFLNRIFPLLQTDMFSNLTFASGIHFGIPTGVTANKNSGKAEYAGPVTNVANRLFALTTESPSFTCGNVSAAVSHSVWDQLNDSLPSSELKQLKLQGKFMLKGITEGIEVFAFQPAAQSTN